MENSVLLKSLRQNQNLGKEEEFKEKYDELQRIKNLFVPQERGS